MSEPENEPRNVGAFARIRAFLWDARDRDPEVRRERVRLALGAMSAVGVALVIGSMVAPFVDPTRSADVWRVLLGIAVGLGVVLLAVWLMRYTKAKE